MNREFHFQGLAFDERAPSHFSEEEWNVMGIERVTVDAQSETIVDEIAYATPGRLTWHKTLLDVVYESKVAYSNRLGYSYKGGHAPRPARPMHR